MIYLNHGATFILDDLVLPKIVYVPYVAKGLVVLLSDHPALPLEVSVDGVMEVEVVEDCGETPHSSRILHAASGFIFSLQYTDQVNALMVMLPSNSG